MTDEIEIKGKAYAVIPEWILYEKKVGASAVRLFGVLGRYLGLNEAAWPSRKTLSSKMGCSLSTVDRAIDELEKIDAIRVEHRYAEKGSQTSSLFYLWPFDHAAPLVKSDDPPLSDLTTLPSSKVIDERTPDERTKIKEYSDDFEAWWKIYPKPVDKGKTFGCWNATMRDRGGTVESIMSATTVFAKKMIEEGREKRHILNSTTFLGTGERWQEYLPESFSSEVLAKSQAWEAYNYDVDHGRNPEQPTFPPPTDSEGHLLDSLGRAYYIDPMDFKRRYVDEE